MSGRLAVDFGTSNTVLTLWNEQDQKAESLHVPEYGKTSLQGDEQISVIPSLIHYAAENRRWIGNQVISRGLYNSRRTFRWMKQYISHRSPLKIQIDDQAVSPFDAGQTFLSSVLTFAGQQINFKDEEVAFSVPVEAYEHYEDWITKVAESAGIRRYRLIDEPSAAALGYSAHIQPGSVYLIFDFGGGTLHAAVVLMETEEKAKTGKRCRVLGKAGRSIGGSRIDQWLFQEILKQNQRRESDEDIRQISTTLLVECERIKEILSYQEQASIDPIFIPGKDPITASFTRSSLEEILDQHELFTQIGQTIRSALNDARERGYTEEQIQAVLMVGGSSQIPSVQKTIRQIFGKEIVKAERPLDAVARGAAAFISGMDFYDHIQHDYAIRYVNPQKGIYDYKPIVQRGTVYPTQQSIARLSIKASYPGQTQLGLAIFEMGQNKPHSSENVELVFDPTGAARIIQVTPQEAEDRSLFWMNEHNPTFLIADPPAAQGEPRFEIEFYIDSNKRLTINARDILTGKLIFDHAPVVKLT